MLLIGGGDQNIKALNVSKLSKYSCHINSILQLPMNEQKMPTSSPKSTLWLLLPTAQLVFPSLQNIIKKEGYILKCMNSKQWQPGRFRHFNHYCCQFYVRINNITFQSEDASNVIERDVGCNRGGQHYWLWRMSEGLRPAGSKPAGFVWMER